MVELDLLMCKWTLLRVSAFAGVYPYVLWMYASIDARAVVCGVCSRSRICIGSPVGAGGGAPVPWRAPVLARCRRSGLVARVSCQRLRSTTRRRSTSRSSRRPRTPQRIHNSIDCLTSPSD